MSVSFAMALLMRRAECACSKAKPRALEGNKGFFSPLGFDRQVVGALWFTQGKGRRSWSVAMAWPTAVPRLGLPMPLAVALLDRLRMWGSLFL